MKKEYLAFQIGLAAIAKVLAPQLPQPIENKAYWYDFQNGEPVPSTPGTGYPIDGAFINNLNN